MSISTPFIQRPIGTALLAIGAMMAGLAAYLALPVASLPNTDLPVIFVSASQPGADPDTMAATVTATLERHLGVISGVNEMTSTSSLGRATVILQFDANRRPADAAKDVQAAINAAAVDLPSGLLLPPSYRKANPNQRPVLILALTSRTLSTQAMFDAADTVLAQRLAQMPGVAQANVLGAEKPAIRVQVDSRRLSAMGLGIDDVRAAIATASVDQPTGRIDGPATAATIAVDDALETAEGFAEIAIAAPGGGVVKLGDVERVFAGVENDRQAAWFGAQRAVLISILKQPGANVIETVEGIRAALPALQRWMPAGVDITPMYHQTQTIRASLHEVQQTLVISCVLVILVVGLFLRRGAPTLAAALAVPLSLAGTFAAMWVLGYSLNTLTLMALTISVGFVVDDAIVMIENIARLRDQGRPAFAAAIEGAREIGFTIVSMTLSLVAVFIPLLFLGGIPGQLMREFAVTLSVAILVSGLAALTLTPMICARFQDDGSPPGWFGRRFDRALGRLVDAYARGLARVLRHRRVMLGLTLATVAGAVGLYVVVPKGGILPQQDGGLLRAFLRAAPDSSFQAMVGRMNEAVRIIAADPAVAAIGGLTGSGTGVGPVSSANTGQMYVTLTPIDVRGVSADAVMKRLRPKLARLEGIEVYLFAEQDLPFGGRSGRAQYQVALLSPTPEALPLWSQTLVRRLQQEPGFTDVSSDLERAGLSAKLVIDRDAAARLGIQPAEIATALNDSFSQRPVATLYRERNQYRVVLEALPQEQRGPDDLMRVHVKGAGGAQIPISAFARVSIETTPLTIIHDGQFSSATLNFGLDDGSPLPEALERMRAVAVELGLPGNMRLEPAGFARLTKQQNSTVPILFVAAVLTIYFVLGILYESWAQALTILSTLPSAGIGALLANLATDTDLSLIGVIGIILLMGIVKKNAIMMVDFALVAERRGGMTADAAIVAACRERFRPILMTTLTALMGAVPLAIAGGVGAELRQPLGIAILGGLGVSQILTLYTTPVVYLALRGRPRAPVRPAHSAGSVA